MLCQLSYTHRIQKGDNASRARLYQASFRGILHGASRTGDVLIGIDDAEMV